MKRRLASKTRPSIVVVAADLGTSAGRTGAAFWALEICAKYMGSLLLAPAQGALPIPEDYHRSRWLSTDPVY